MPVTLGWLLGRTALDLRLLSGADQQERVIGWAHAIELEDPSPWLRGGELVLTTGLRLPADADAQHDYVDRLAGSGATALGFGVGVEHDEVPHGIRERCADVGLPLVEVPLPVPFVAITQAVAAAYAAEQQESLQRVLTVQQQLTSTALTDGVPGLARGVAQALGCEVIVVDHHLTEVCCESPHPARLREAVRGELLGRRPLDPPTSIHVLDDASALSVQSLGGRGNNRGWLGVRAPQALSATDRLLVNQAASLITLQLEDRPALSRFERQVGTVVLRRLLHDEAPDPEALLVVHRLGLPADGDVVVLAVAATTTHGPRAGEGPEAVLAGAFDEARLPHLACTTDAATPATYVLVAAETAERALAAVTTRLTSKGRHDLAVGVSSNRPLDRTHEAGSQAVRALQAAHWQRRQAIRFDHLRLDAVVDDPQIGPRIDELTAPVLAPLLELGEPTAGELLGSVESFVQHNGSWEAASRALNVHRHTLRHRIARVERLTGLQMDCAQDRMLVLMALLARARRPRRR